MPGGGGGLRLPHAGKSGQSFGEGCVVGDALTHEVSRIHLWMMCPGVRGPGVRCAGAGPMVKMIPQMRTCTTNPPS